MIKLKFDANIDGVEMYRGNRIITTLNSEDFGSLMQEIKRIMKEASPAIERKQSRKEERKQLWNNLKILLAIKAIDFLNWVKNLWAEIKKTIKS